MNWWNNLQEWFLNLGTQYGVNPIIFGTIYIGAIPFFLLSLSWLVRNLRRKQPIVVPVLLTGFFFVSAYLYLIIAGRNIPVWVYGFMAALIGYGAYSTVQKIKKQSAEK
jgi:hypothetical protein